MLEALPLQFWLLTGACVLFMMVAAFFLGAPLWWQRGLARAALVAGGAGLFVGTMAYLSVFVAVLVVALPLALIVFFFTDLLGGLF
ncbi:hypothetical protein [Tateyamaria sp. SN6-1]|uniref:hypothetical protein n=1 Tax=Tateyamaria sp. SN6-1 TaxID=3092148 RepID=UPI0039F567C3